MSTVHCAINLANYMSIMFCSHSRKSFQTFRFFVDSLGVNKIKTKLY